MPIFEYECRGCGEQFELLVLKGTVASCPACQSQNLEQLVSGFAVSSIEMTKANVKAARAKLKTSKNYIDSKVAEADDIREHMEEAPPPPPPPKPKV